jgi:hypothetical protein
MKATWWFRISAVLFLLFAVGHTFGFLAFRPPTAEGLAVWAAMNDVHFTVGRSTFSYGGFYLGFGLFMTAFNLFLAWLAWQLGSMARRGLMDARTIAWGIFALQIVGAGLSVRFFSVEPVVLSALVAGCLAMAAVSTRQSTAAS